MREHPAMVGSDSSCPLCGAALIVSNTSPDNGKRCPDCGQIEHAADSNRPDVAPPSQPQAASAVDDRPSAVDLAAPDVSQPTAGHELQPCSLVSETAAESQP